MSQFVINLGEPEKDERKAETPKPEEKKAPKAVETKEPKKRGGCGRILLISGIALAVLLLVGVVVGSFYWQGLKTKPQYSLALLVDAARRGDQKAIDELVDIDAVVESFMPQIIDKAKERFGKNLPVEKLAKVKDVSATFMPAIKQRAREEVPRVIKEKADKFPNVPYWMIAIGAGYFLDFKTQAETSVVTSSVTGNAFEVSMKRVGEIWRVVGIKDDALADRIAATIGQELIDMSSKEVLKKVNEKINVPEKDKPKMDDLKKKLDDLFGK